MRPSWKLALIGGEVTLLAAFTGIGIHLAMRPHRTAFQPPPLVLPTSAPAAIPTLATPLVPPRPRATPTASPPSLGAELFSRFGQQDRNLLVDQWSILQQLTRAIARYLEAKVVEQLERKS